MLEAYIALNEYHLVWIDPNKPAITNKGTYLFNSPEEARTTIQEMEKSFPTFVIWLEDRECNKVEIS
jgi:hypothetical protein